LGKLYESVWHGEAIQASAFGLRLSGFGPNNFKAFVIPNDAFFFAA